MQFWIQPYQGTTELADSDSIRIIEAFSSVEARRIATEKYGGLWHIAIAPRVNGYKVRPDGMIVTQTGYSPHSQPQRR